MSMDLDNIEARHDIYQLQEGPRFESLTFVEQPDEDYLSFFQNVLDDFFCKDLNAKELVGVDHFVNLVENSENEVSNGVEHFVNLVENSDKEVFDDDDDDPQYKFFSSHLKGNGNSYTFEMKQENGLCKLIEYNKEEAIDGRQDLKKKKNIMKDTVAENTSKRSRSERKEGKNVKKSCLRALSPERINTRSHKSTSKSQSVSRFQPKSNNDGLVKMGEEQFEKSHNVGGQIMKWKQDSLIESEYQYFRSLVEIENGRIILPLNSDKEIVCYGEVNSGNVLSHEVKSLRPRSCGKNNVEEADRCQILDKGETYKLKGKLMALLRKPFDEQEYNTLWDEVTEKKYKLRHRELQNGREKSVPTKIKAKSYLQKHKGFRRAIKAVAEDKFKKLNILRGFSFWLQHLAWGGTFKPWEDASCLAVMPGSQ